MVAPPSNQRILAIVPDDEALGTLSRILRSLGHPVVSASDLSSGLERLAENDHDLVILDAEVGRVGLRRMLDALGAAAAAPPLVVLAGRTDLTAAVEAVEQGAADYLSRPPRPAEVASRISRILRLGDLDDRLSRLQDEIAKRGRLDGLVARSTAMQALMERVRRIAPTRSTVLIQGESGAGKELVARAIHFSSRRRGGPFIPINCAAIPPGLIESELFGHERGAFTGALARRKGRFELAQGGTLFLDEVAETDPATQAKLLRVLEEREFMRVGGTQPVRVDVRVLAATNADLEALVRTGRFRRDLFFRLKVVTVGVPPLRERRDDLPDLVDRFTQQICRANLLPPRPLRPEVVDAFLSHDWPGNVRELINTLESALVSSRGPELTLEDLPASVRASRSDGLHADLAVPGRTLRDLERELIGRTLAAERGHRARTAKILGIGERTLRRKMHAYGLEAPRGRRRSTA